MVDTTRFLASADIAKRTGMIETRYRTSDGRFILDSRDLARIRIEGDEFVTGLKGLEVIDGNEAKRLIKENGYKVGLGERQLPDESEQSEEQTNEEGE